MQLPWTLQTCVASIVYQGFLVSLPLLATGLLLRLCVATGLLGHATLNTLAATLGVYILWWFYSSSVFYFILLCVLVYVLLLVVPRQRGVVVGATSVIFITSW